MADQLKEIYNNTVYIGQLTNGVTVASTDATTQLVIKDAQVSANSTMTAVSVVPTLQVNNSFVGNLSYSLSGSEIVDVSSTVTASATATFSSLAYSIWPALTASSTISTNAARLVNGVAGYTSTSTAAANSTGYSGGINDFWTVGSDFFYTYNDTNSSCYLLRRLGGPTGTENSASNASYEFVVKGNTDKFHRVSNSNVVTYSATTNSTSSVSITHPSWGASITSYPRASFANGLVFWSSSSQSATMWAFNPTTGKACYMNSGFTSMPTLTTYTVMEVCYVGGSYYILVTNSVAGGGAGNIYVYRVADFGGLTSTDIYATATLLYTLSSAYTPYSNLNDHWPKLDKNTGDFYFLSSVSGSVFTYKVYNIVTGLRKSDFVVTMGNTTPSYNALSTPSTSDDTANKTNTTLYPQSMRLRITGVQSTL